MSSEDVPHNTSETPTESKLLDIETRYRARVKWFNNRAGYGFATIQSHNRKGEDVFVHHSGISVTSEQYKYLVQGEYVEFNLRQSNHEKHPYQADQIRGVDNGMLMCETHAEEKEEKGEMRVVAMEMNVMVIVEAVVHIVYMAADPVMANGGI